MSLKRSSTSNDFEDKFFEGISIHEKGETRESLKFFLDMLIDYPESVGVLMFLGSIYHDLGCIKLSIKYASRATNLSPISEKSSFILHNVLRDSGYKREAYEEMERFFNTRGARPSEELYETYLSDLARSLDILQEQYSDKRMLVRSVIEELGKLGVLENEEDLKSPPTN